MNLINDGRHAFFGTMCDVIVSNDNDFLTKCRFMYDIGHIGIKVIGFAELESFIDQYEMFSRLSIAGLFKEINTPVTAATPIEVVQEDGEKRYYLDLHHTYYSYFNLLTVVTDEFGTYWSVCRRPVSFRNNPFVLEIQQVVSRLLEDLGNDLYQNGKVLDTEQIDDKSEIRVWSIEGFVFSLVVDEILYLNIYPLEYLQKRWKKKDEPATS